MHLLLFFFTYIQLYKFFRAKLVNHCELFPWQLYHCVWSSWWPLKWFTWESLQNNETMVGNEPHRPKKGHWIWQFPSWIIVGNPKWHNRHNYPCHPSVLLNELPVCALLLLAHAAWTVEGALVDKKTPKRSLIKKNTANTCFTVLDYNDVTDECRYSFTAIHLHYFSRHRARIAHGYYFLIIDRFRLCVIASVPVCR